MKLSHSALNTYLTCEQKFAHRYLFKTDPDPDYKEGHALNFGKAFHRVLENCQHDYHACSTQLMQGACMEFGLSWDNDGAKLAACLRSYFAGYDLDWKCIRTEVWWETSDHHGCVDGVFVKTDNSGLWRIADLKTVGVKLDPTIRVKLATDQQVTMYVKHRHLIAKICGLDVDKFDGVSYREVEKPRQRYKDDLKTEDGTRPETFAEFTVRCGNPTFRDTVIQPHELIYVEETFANITNTALQARALADRVANGESPTQNRQSCKQYGSACPYWSHCYNMTYTESCAQPTQPTQSVEDKPDVADLF